MLGGAVLMLFDFSFRNILIWLVLFGGISVLYMLFMPQLMGLQAYFAIRSAKSSLDKLGNWSESSKKTALEKITGYGKSPDEVKRDLEDFLEFFTIEPVSEDPLGVLDRLEHLLDVRKTRYEEATRRLAPEADEEELADLEMTVEGAASSYAIYKIVRHYIAVAEKTKSMQLAQLLQMQMPMLEKMAEAYRDATEAFAEGGAIGDGVGAMVAAKLIADAETEEKVKGTVYAETDLEGRKIFVIKAKGPGGRTGKPGELIKELAEKHKPDLIITVDAALKLEGEESGESIEGVGAALGGPPTEKHKIEELATEMGTPLDAFVVKEGLREVLTPMSESLSQSVDDAVEKVKRAVLERSGREDVVFIAGIGNTIGIGQTSGEIPTEFPEVEKEEGELESFALMPGVGGILDRASSLLKTGGEEMG